MNRSIAFSLFALAACSKEGPNTRPLTETEQALVGSSNTFSFEVMREISAAKAGENVFISPLSISMALGMTYNGARGETERGIRTALSYGEQPAAEINEGWRGLIELLINMDPSVTFEIANSIWYRDGFNVDPAFVTTNKTSFDAEVAALDFSSDGAADAINSWVRAKTHDKIDGIIEGGIDPQTIMFLIDALYFKGTWTYEFKKSATFDGDFTLADGSKKSVKMMHQSASFTHGFGENFAALDLPYGFELFNMTILLPNEGTTADELVDGFTQEKWNALRGDMTTTEIAVTMPRFELEYEQSLNDVLTALGMGKAFDFDADFSGITPDGGIYISDVKHKTFVRVDEEGTEAAAVTSVEFRVVSLPPEFSVDRPFAFVIHDKHSGAILFMGKIVEPADG